MKLPRTELGMIGVLGGMGPAATGDFFNRLVAMVGAERDQDHPSCLVYSATQIPDRTAHLTAQGPDPGPALQAAALVLERGGATVIAIPCNSAHAYHAEISAAVSIPVLDMIALAARALRREHGAGTRVGVLAATGTVRLGLYDRQLESRGLVPVLPGDDLQDEVMAAIREVKGGGNGPDSRLMRSIDELAAAGAEVGILGCTELPLAVDTTVAPIPMVDATAVLAQAALEHVGVTFSAD